MNSIRGVLAAALLMVHVAPALAAQASASGLALMVSPRASRDGSVDRDLRVAPSLALFVDRDEAPSAFVGGGVFDATFSGEIELPARDDYRFSFVGVGNFTLEIDGEVVLTGVGKGAEPVLGAPKRLRKGRRALVARYRSPLSGMAELRVAWEGTKLPRQLVPPTVLFHDPAVDGLSASSAARIGKMTIATHRCTACHAPPALTSSAIPELAMRGPSLRDAGARFRAEALAQWILDPSAMRRGARMPRVLHGVRAQEEARDIASFLVTLGADGAMPQAAGDAERGGLVWARLGCFTCHALRADDVGGFVALDHAAALYRPGAIAEFVAAPAAREPFTRMADLRLTAAEAIDLEAFLRSGKATAAPSENVGDAQRGRSLFAARGCANCHDAGVESTLAAAPLATVLAAERPGGCLATDAAARGAAPEFAWTDASRGALREFAARGVASLGVDNRVEFADRQIEERRCAACHQLGAEPSQWTQREELVAPLLRPHAPVEGQVEVAQNRPPLTFVGEKLRLDWMEAFLAGREPSPRPWLHARMPRLGSELAHGLALGLAARSGYGRDARAPSIDRAQVAIGRGLIESQGGFGCVTCHSVAGRAPAALFEVAGIDFALVAARLRPEYYASWMLDPTRYDAASKMPRFANDELRTALDPLGGDARAQFDAVWQWLHGADELKERR